MSSKPLVLDAILNELGVVKSLGTKVPADRLDDRPTPGQRSLLELLQHLSYCGHRVAAVMPTGDPEVRETYGREGEEATLETFGAAIDRQGARVREIVAGIADDEGSTRTIPLPWGPETTPDGLVLNATLRFLTAYRMQLGLELGTHECWLGRDAPREMKV